MIIEFYRLGFPKTLSITIATLVSTAPLLSSAKTQSLPSDLAAGQKLTLMIETALVNDTSRAQYAAQSKAMRETAVASATLMDPKLKVGFGGLPVDSFEFDQDPMTNVSLGLMQQFERGSTLDLNRQGANQKADAVAYQIKVREREVANSITQLWLELGYLQYTASLIHQNQKLMQEMEQYMQTNYSIGKSEAQDLLNTQIQVGKLDEKLQLNRQKQNRLIAQLSEWLGADWQTEGLLNSVSYQLPWTQLESILSNAGSQSQYYPLLNQHPLVQVAESNISVNRTQVEVAEQAFTPQFGVEVMYAYRQANNMMGEPASDLVSAYLTMDIPLFIGNRQDKNLAAAQYQVGASQYQKDTLLAQMSAQVSALLNDRTNMTERIERYQERLLPQAKARIEAVERGYQNNTTEFGEVITASTDELALKIELTRLITDLNQTNSQLASLLGGFEYQVAAPTAKYQ
ncbi:TolC family protein [Vibrio sp.]|uniref:TolC family protein n=1 Tax=Vibrio sp. TaxID=678 RepID=UPI0035302AAB